MNTDHYFPHISLAYCKRPEKEKLKFLNTIDEKLNKIEATYLSLIYADEVKKHGILFQKSAYKNNDLKKSYIINYLGY